MRDCEKLAKALRCCHLTSGSGCAECPRRLENNDSCYKLLPDAADAINELLAERDQYKAYFDNVSSLPDCNVCLKQSICEFVPAWGENTRINCPLALTEPPKEETE